MLAPGLASLLLGLAGAAVAPATAGPSTRSAVERSALATPLAAAAIPLDARERAEAARLRREAERAGGDAGEPAGGTLDVPGWLRVVAIGVAVIVVLGGAVLLVRWAGRRTPVAEREPREPRVTGPDPDDLDAEARAAAARGEHGAAVLLRYRAGLLRLRARDALPARPLTPREVARAIATEPDDDRLAPLVRDVEAVAYAGREVGAEASAAAEGWSATAGRGRA